jgi:parallel beta-helix repeat protein
MVVRIAIGHVSADPALTGIMPILIDRIFASSAILRRRKSMPHAGKRKVNKMRYVHLFPTRAFAPGLSCAVAMFLTTTGSVAAVECGEVLTGVEQLDEDLICTSDPALTLSGGKLDRRGHTVICDGTMEGIVLDGDGAQVLNGAVAGCQFAVLVEGTGNHLVTNLTASVQDPVLDDEEGAEGLRVLSDGNRLVRNRVLLGGTNAIRINGAGNHVEGNTVSGSQRGIRIDGIENEIVENVIAGVAEGIEVRGASNQIGRNQIAGAIDQAIELRGAGNQVDTNLAVDAVGDGISIFSNDNLIRGNGAFSNGDDGIIVVATFSNNRIVNNRALGNGTDLTDQNVDCDANVWANNTFGSADPDDCID